MPSWNHLIYRLSRLDLTVKTVGGCALTGLEVWRTALQISVYCPALFGDPMMLALPSLTILAAALAAIPAVIRAVRIDPVEMLRAE